MPRNARGANLFLLILMIVVALAASEIVTYILDKYVHALSFLTKTVQIINIPPSNLDLNIARFTLGFDLRLNAIAVLMLITVIVLYRRL